jgi:hypothetical protein
MFNKASMRSKPLFGTFLVPWFIFTSIVDSAPAAPEPRTEFFGAKSCSSTSCHGGAGANKDQYLVWSRQDYHSRAYATLTTARSARLAEALRVEDPVQSNRCTSCHAPVHELPRAGLSPSLKISEGVSCENCHGPAESWIRSHTRLDLSHQDKTALGLRDLRNFYVRANSCVACHQNVEPALLKAGHPELIFELDGQSVTQPRHWRERTESYGPALWLVGQAVALREMSSQLGRQIEKQSEIDSKQTNRWAGLLWLLKKTEGAAPELSALSKFPFEPSRENLKQVQDTSDQIARAAGDFGWTEDLTQKLLRQLASVSGDFDDRKIPPPVQARRAERLVLALDRLVTALPTNGPAAKADRKLDELFRSVQSLPDFDPATFSKQLAEFARQLE